MSTHSNEQTVRAVSESSITNSLGVKTEGYSLDSEKSKEVNVQANKNEVTLTTNLKIKPTLPNCASISSNKDNNNNRDTVFTLKKWNLVAMWSWDVECEVCAICRTPLMDSCLKCQTDNKHDDCVVVWGDCNHSFHNCCMSQWIKSRNLCPLCQSEWHVQRIGR